MYLAAWRYQQFHPSHLLAWLAVGLMGGLIAANISLCLESTLLFVSSLLLIIGAFRGRRWWSIGVLIVCGIVLGLMRGSEMKNSLEGYVANIGGQVTISGSIKDDPVYGLRGDQQFRLTNVELNGAKMPGDVFVGTYNILDIKRGHRVTLSGKLSKGFGSYQASLRYATMVSAVEMQDPVREFRDRFAAAVRNVMAEPAASLGLGFVVGQRSALPETLDEQLRIVGLTHIVVASGYNLTILVRFTRRLLARHSKYLAATVSTGLMAAFVAVSGLSPSMTRASLVTGLSLLAWYYGRRFHPVVLILYAAAITAMLNPIYIWSDIGWYLSFLAFSGVLIVAPLLVKLIWKERDAPTVGQLIVETISAQILTLPLILLLFGQLPVLSIISNVLVAPIIPLAMLLTTLSGIVSLLPGDMFNIVGVAASYVVGYVIAVVQWLSSASWAQLNVSIAPFMMIGCYVAIGVVAVVLAWRLRYDFRASSVVD